MSSWLPYPPDNGSRQRAYHLLKQMAARHDVSLVALYDADQTPPQLDALRPLTRNVTAFPRKLFDSREGGGLRALLSPTPRYITATFDPNVRAAIHELLCQNTFDAIVAGELSMAVYAAELEHPHKLFDDVEIGMYQDGHERARGWARWRSRLTWEKHKRFVRNLATRFKRVTVVSEKEQARVQAIGIAREKIVVMPNGVDCDAADAIAAQAEPLSLIYNGAVTYAANLDAAFFFVKEILPRVRAQEPGVKLRITGRADQVAQNELSADNVVSFTGYVSDVKPLVKASAVCIVPLRQGGGTRLKILEAMALRTPVVSTTKGAEGLDVRHGEHLLIADSPREFADAVLVLLRDNSLRTRLTTNAYAHVRAQYDWNGIGQRWNRLLAECMSPTVC